MPQKQQAKRTIVEASSTGTQSNRSGSNKVNDDRDAKNGSGSGSSGGRKRRDASSPPLPPSPHQKDDASLPNKRSPAHSSAPAPPPSCSAEPPGVEAVAPIGGPPPPLPGVGLGRHDEGRDAKQYDHSVSSRARESRSRQLASFRFRSSSPEPPTASSPSAFAAGGGGTSSHQATPKAGGAGGGGARVPLSPSAIASAATCIASRYKTKYCRTILEYRAEQEQARRLRRLKSMEKAKLKQRKSAEKHEQQLLLDKKNQENKKNKNLKSDEKDDDSSRSSSPVEHNADEESEDDDDDELKQIGDGPRPCPYEHRCMFAHTESELRTTEMNVEEGLITEEAVKLHKLKEFHAAMAVQQQAHLEEQEKLRRERRNARAMGQGNTGCRGGGGGGFGSDQRRTQYPDSHNSGQRYGRRPSTCSSSNNASLTSPVDRELLSMSGHSGSAGGGQQQHHHRDGRDSVTPPDATMTLDLGGGVYVHNERFNNNHSNNNRSSNNNSNANSNQSSPHHQQQRQQLRLNTPTSADMNTQLQGRVGVAPPYTRVLGEPFLRGNEEQLHQQQQQPHNNQHQQHQQQHPQPQYQHQFAPQPLHHPPPHQPPQQQYPQHHNNHHYQQQRQQQQQQPYVPGMVEMLPTTTALGGGEGYHRQESMDSSNASQNYNSSNTYGYNNNNSFPHNPNAGGAGNAGQTFQLQPRRHSLDAFNASGNSASSGPPNTATFPPHQLNSSLTSPVSAGGASMTSNNNIANTFRPSLRQLYSQSSNHNPPDVVPIVVHTPNTPQNLNIHYYHQQHPKPEDQEQQHQSAGGGGRGYVGGGGSGGYVNTPYQQQQHHQQTSSSYEWNSSHYN